MIKWPQEQGESISETIIDRYAEYPGDDAEFSGLYGFFFFTNRFIDESKRFFLVESTVKGTDRIFIVDVETKEVKMLRSIGDTGADLRRGNYILLAAYKDTLIVKYTDLWTPPRVYSIRFKEVDKEN